MRKQITQLNHNGDLYEIALDGFLITRISCYWAGSPMRKDMQYADLPTEVQEGILDKITELLSDDE